MTNDKNNPLDLASRLQQLRKQRGLSQEELAGQLGVSRQAVSKWESAQAQPELEKLLALSDFFQVSCDYLLKGKRRRPSLYSRRQPPQPRQTSLTAWVM